MKWGHWAEASRFELVWGQQVQPSHVGGQKFVADDPVMFDCDDVAYLCWSITFRSTFCSLMVVDFFKSSILRQQSTAAWQHDFHLSCDFESIKDICRLLELSLGSAANYEKQNKIKSISLNDDLKWILGWLVFEFQIKLNVHEDWPFFI
jgi:hypothetical protein